MIFCKSWSRFTLELAIKKNIQHSGLSGGRNGPHYYSSGELSSLTISNGLNIEKLSGCGGPSVYIVNLAKSWLSPFGIRIFRHYWWGLIDGILKPLYILAAGIDTLLPLLPSSWVVIARKPK